SKRFFRFPHHCFSTAGLLPAWVLLPWLRHHQALLKLILANNTRTDTPYGAALSLKNKLSTLLLILLPGIPTRQSHVPQHVLFKGHFQALEFREGGFGGLGVGGE
ncbi:hypothetical protein M406DRAFT_102052, partial [Cryphonectria parasitica EP155]